MTPTPKEMALQLINKKLPHVAGADRYSLSELYHLSIAKTLALDSVDDMLNFMKAQDESTDSKLMSYLLSVMDEIEKIQIP